MADIKEILTGILGDATEGLWDREKDEEFLKEVGKELATLQAKKLAGSPVPDTEIAILEETLLQRAAQKGLRTNDFERLLKLAIRIIRAVV